MYRDDFDLDIQVKNYGEEIRNAVVITTAITCTCKTCDCPPATTWITCK